jgi:hypothetical protein
MDSSMDLKRLFVEKVSVGSDGLFCGSKCVEANDIDIAMFMSKPCDHSLHVDKLIYDIPGCLYGSRYCGVCDELIGLI